MSAITQMTQPSGTITVGQSVNYTFALDGPYPVTWIFTQFGVTTSGTANNNTAVTIPCTVPSNPNASIGSLSFSGPGDTYAHVFKLSPLDGFSEVIYPKITTDLFYSNWMFNSYGNCLTVPNGTTKLLYLDVNPLGTGAPLTTASFPMTVYITQMQVYPTTGSETTVATQTFNTLASYLAFTYTTPSVTATTGYKYTLYTTNPSATAFTADTSTSKGSVILFSSTQAPFIYSQPSSTTIPWTSGGVTYNSIAMGVKYISNATPTVTWYRNGSPVPSSWVIPTKGYGGYDSSIVLDVTTCTNGDTFYCTVVDANGTAASSTATLTVNTPTPIPDSVSVTAAATSDTTLANGGTLTLSAQAVSSGTVSYQWYQNNTAIVGATSQTLVKAVSNLDDGSTFKVVATVGTATSTSQSVKIRVYSPSGVSSFILGGGANFTASASTVGNPGSTFNYSWDFSDGDTLYGNPVNKNLNTTGSLLAKVTATDTSTGGTAIASKTINVKVANWIGNTAYARVWTAMTYGNGLFVTGANDNTSGTNGILTSPDGSTWTQRNSPVLANFLSAAYGNGTYVMVGTHAGANYVVYSTDGITWTAPTFPSRQWQAIAYGNGVFAALSYLNGTTGQAMTSPDGITWTSRNTASNQDWRAICYGGGQFVAVCTGGTTMTSPDGINWTSHTAAPSQSWISVAYGNGIYVAVANVVTSNQVMWSSDGITWHLVSLPDAGVQVRSVSYGDGQFVITPTTPNLTWGSYLTPDCQTFYRVSTNVPNGTWNCSVYGTDRFVSMSGATSTQRAQVLLW